MNLLWGLTGLPLKSQIQMVATSTGTGGGAHAGAGSPSPRQVRTWSLLSIETNGWFTFFEMLILIVGWWCSCKQTSRLMIHVCFYMCCCVILEIQFWHTITWDIHFVVVPLCCNFPFIIFIISCVYSALLHRYTVFHDDNDLILRSFGDLALLDFSTFFSRARSQRLSAHLRTSAPAFLHSKHNRLKTGRCGVWVLWCSKQLRIKKQRVKKVL